MITIMKGAVKIIDLSQNGREKSSQALMLSSFDEHNVSSPGAAIKYQVKGRQVR
jgi:hypothetical protein